MCDFGFLTDITGDLNELNCRLQGKVQLIHTLYYSIKGYQTKLILWEHQLKLILYVSFESIILFSHYGVIHFLTNPVFPSSCLELCMYLCRRLFPAFLEVI